MAGDILLAIQIDGCMIQRGTSAACLDRWMRKREPETNPADERRAALMEAAQAGDRAAYTTLLRECVPFIRSVASRRVPVDRIDDVVQDALLTIHRARRTYDSRYSLSAWLHTIADRRAIDISRRITREARREIHAPLLYEQHADEALDPARAEDQSDAVFRVRSAVATLPAGQREAVQRLVLDEQSLNAAAQKTGRSEGALKVNLHRAIKTLRMKLERDSL
ncbi:MAG: RNA polymerase sigma factor [Xanthobacteraceae bacterium]